MLQIPRYSGLVSRICCALVAGLLMPAALQADVKTAPDFDQLLLETGMTFSMPEGFTTVAVQQNTLFGYDKAVATASRSVEIRYAIRPIARMSIDYEDPHSAAPRPNDIFNMLFDSLINTLASGGSMPTNTYRPGQAQEFFNAGWAAAGIVDPDKEFSANYRQALIIAMHRDDQADAYMIVLYNDAEQLRLYKLAALKSLRFENPVEGEQAAANNKEATVSNQPNSAENGR